MDKLYFWSQVAGAFFVVVALIAGRIVNNKQSGQISDLNERTQELKRSNLSLEKDVADAKTRQAEAETARLELEQFIKAPRDFATEEANPVLSGRPKGTIEIKCVMDNPEASSFANKIADAFRSNGWTFPKNGISFESGPPPIQPGITVIFRKETGIEAPNLPEPANTVRECFHVALRPKHFPSPIRYGALENFEQGKVVIEVGAKY